MGILRNKKGDEVLVEFPHFYYLSQDGKKCSQFWLHKDSIVELDTVSKHNLDTLIPEPINYRTLAIPHENILTLIHPWRDPVTNMWFSVGTRFIRHKDEDTPTRYGIIYIDYNTMCARTAQVRTECALTELPTTSDDAIRRMLSILRSWIYDQDTIAYVWGGTSYIDRYTQEFELVEEVRNNVTITNWQRPRKPGTRCGFDCSGLILRVAHMVGIPYFCKNTATLNSILNEVPIDEPLKEGDLILYKGHVMIISDLENHVLIDASSYPKGYGCLREVSLSDVFDKISTYDDLRQWALLDKPLGIKNIQGTIIAYAAGLKLLRLS